MSSFRANRFGNDKKEQEEDMITKKYLKEMSEEDAGRLKQQILGTIRCRKEDNKTVPNTADITCPHCGSKKIIRWGYNGNVQKYHCKNCFSYFSSTTNTVFSSSAMDYEVWSAFLDCEFRGMALQEEADLISRSRTTCFNMRRKFYRIAEKLITAGTV